MAMCTKAHSKTLNSQVFPGIQGGPLMHVIAAKAVALHEAAQPAFTTYAKQVIANAQALASGLLEGGLSLVSGGTDNHLLLVDLKDTDLTGKAAEHALEAAAITVNKNTVPGETRSPFVTSGLRIGTPALTSRGMGQAEMARIAAWIVEILDDIEDRARQERIRDEVLDLCSKHPIYPGRLAAARRAVASDC
jgi:glycine hydroxymethyltransferase